MEETWQSGKGGTLPRHSPCSAAGASGQFLDGSRRPLGHPGVAVAVHVECRGVVPVVAAHNEFYCSGQACSGSRGTGQRRTRPSNGSGRKCLPRWWRCFMIRTYLGLVEDVSGRRLDGVAGLVLGVVLGAASFSVIELLSACSNSCTVNNPLLCGSLGRSFLLALHHAYRCVCFLRLSTYTTVMVYLKELAWYILAVRKLIEALPLVTFTVIYCSHHDSLSGYNFISVYRTN